MFESLRHSFIFENIFIRVGCKLYRQIVGISKVPNCAALVADLVCCLFSDNNQADVI